MTDRDEQDPGDRRDSGEEKPAQPTEEYLLEGLDDSVGDAPGPASPEPGASEPGTPEPEAPEPGASEPVAPESEAPEPEAAEPGDSPDPGPEQPVDLPTEEVFAFEADLLSGEDAPELDPVFRAALLESPERAGSPESAQAAGSAPAETTPPEGPAGEARPADAPPEEGPAEGAGDQAEGAGGSAGEAGDSGDGPAEEAGAAEEPVSEGGVTAEQTLILTAAARSEAQLAIEESRRTGEPWDPPRLPSSGDFDAPGKRKHYWWRFGLATLIIIFSFAGATSASVLTLVDNIGEGISEPSLKLSDKILPASNGGPQTIAILGSDQRTGGGAAPGDPGRSDTTILLRLDPDSGQIAMLSIPRDLKVEIPGTGTDKFNAAFSYGGPKLTLKTIKQLTGLDVNHVINVDFQGFASVVDAIGCVYVDVDREYYNSNEGLAASEQYAEIDIDAGYQKLCGPDALEFARYRHTDSDLARAARQQDLVGEVRNRLSFGEILKRNNELINAFTDNTSSDIKDGDEILELLKLLFDSRGADVVEVKFPATDLLESGVSYLVSTPDEVDAAVDKFLGFEDAIGPVGTLSEGESAGSDRARKKAIARAKKKARREKKKEAASATTAPGKDQDGLVDASQGGLEAAMGLDAEIKRRDFAVYYPKRLPSGTIYSEGSRTYHVRDPDKKSYPAYRMVMALQLGDGLHYFGLQGVRGWGDPPILEAPSEDISMDGRDFRVYPEGDRVRLVAWSEGGNTYWISNSILLTLTNEQMLGMARSTRAFTPGS
ncbi:MAG: LCP family protein [Thermoleophilia bacterium]|nr:LCP family protein [Thermoleophilia bacterium]